MNVPEQREYIECKPSLQSETSQGNLWGNRHAVLSWFYTVIYTLTKYLYIKRNFCCCYKKTVYDILNLCTTVFLLFTINKQPITSKKPKSASVIVWLLKYSSTDNKTLKINLCINDNFPDRLPV